MTFENRFLFMMDFADSGLLWPFHYRTGPRSMKNIRDLSRGLESVWRMHVTSFSAHVSFVAYRCVFSVCLKYLHCSPTKYNMLHSCMCTVYRGWICKYFDLTPVMTQ
jgi:hypothetical protein